MKKQQSKFRKSILEQETSITKKKHICKSNIFSSFVTFVLIIYVFFMVAIATFTLFQPHMRKDLERYIKKEIEVYVDDKTYVSIDVKMSAIANKDT